MLLIVKKIMKYLITLEMPVTSCEINLILTWSERCMLSNDTKSTTFAITDTKPCVGFVTLSTRGYGKLL